MDADFWKPGPLDASLNYKHCNIIYQVRGNPDPVSYLKFASGTPFGPEDTLTLVPRGDYNTQTLYCSWAGNLAFWFDGTMGQTNSLNLAAQYLNRPQDPFGFGCATGFSLGWSAVRTFLGNPEWTGLTNVYLIGHSFGAAISCCANNWFQANYPAVNVSHVTYGSPRPGDQILQSTLSRRNLTRWYTAEDPVPHCPPHSDESPTLAVLLPASFMNLLNNQVQPPVGWQISTGGVYLQGEGQEAIPPEVVLSLGNWLAGATVFGSPNHAITAYGTAFLNAVGLRQPSQQPVPAADWGQPENPTSTQLSQQVQQGTEQLKADAVSPTGQSASAPVVRVAASSPAPYSRRKMGNVWVVTFQGQVVSAASGKRNAGSIARRLNRAARSLPS
jgi:hypothetical protein